jgi:hypothetical protein
MIPAALFHFADHVRKHRLFRGLVHLDKLERTNEIIPPFD